MGKLNLAPVAIVKQFVTAHLLLQLLICIVNAELLERVLKKKLQ